MHLHLLVCAGDLKLALSTERVLRLLPTGSAPGRSLAQVLGRQEAPGPEAALLELRGVDGPLLVDRVTGVRETTLARFFILPLATRLSRPAARRLLELDDAFHVELDLDGLFAAGPHDPEPPRAVPPAEVPSRVLTFRAGERRFAIPFGLVQGIVSAPRLTLVPLTPPAHLGVFSHGGAILPAFDLASITEGDPPALGALLLVIEAGGQLLGVSADEVEGVVACARLDDVHPLGAWVELPRAGRALLPVYDALF